VEDSFARGLEDLIGRDSGPLHLRLVVQPVVAGIFAIRSGLKDARESRPVFFWTLVLDPAQRSDLLQQGWKDVGKLFIAAIILDVIYQIIVFHRLYPVQTLIVATILAIVPYLVVRGLTNRIVSWTLPGQPRE
jgi:hypothetical protein